MSTDGSVFLAGDSGLNSEVSNAILRAIEELRPRTHSFERAPGEREIGVIDEDWVRNGMPPRAYRIVMEYLASLGRKISPEEIARSFHRSCLVIRAMRVSTGRPVQTREDYDREMACLRAAREAIDVILALGNGSMVWHVSTVYRDGGEAWLAIPVSRAEQPRPKIRAVQLHLPELPAPDAVHFSLTADESIPVGASC